MSETSRRDFLKLIAATTMSLGLAEVAGAPPLAWAASNLALGQPADSSSDANGTHTALQAVDGNTSTEWVASNSSFPQWLVVDLGAISTITSVIQTFANNTTWYYQIQGSNTNLSQDGSWTDWHILVDRTTTGVSGQTITENLNAAYRYVRLYVTGSGDGSWAASQEFQVFGQVLAQPRNIVPVPNPVSTGSYLIGAQMCNLWGAQYQWNRLPPYTDRISLMGTYDESYDVATDWQIKMAVEHGINFFLPCWFRAHGNAGKPVMSVFDQFINSLANSAQYRNSISWAIMWENTNGIASSVTGVSDFTSNVVPFWINNYFSKSNYLKISNKPVLSIYNLSAFISAVGGQANATSAISQFRQAVANAGYAGLILLTVEDGNTTQNNSAAVAVGIDYTYSYTIPTFTELMSTGIPMDAQAMSWEQTAWNNYTTDDGLPYITSVTVGWDSTPWGHSSSSAQWRLSPTDYTTLLQSARTTMGQRPAGSLANTMLLLDNWNEYGEGHDIAPTQRDGYAYLNAVQSVFSTSNANNDVLPDTSQIPQLLSVTTGTLGGTYQIRNVNSSLYLEITSQSTTQGAVADQDNWSEVASQKWTITSLGSGQYQIQNVNSGLYLGITSQETTPGATADQDQWYGAASQKWVFTSLGNGQYQIKNVNSSLYLGITSQETNPGATADQDQWYGAASQKWMLALV